jgi:hypothetical protein
MAATAWIRSCHDRSQVPRLPPRRPPIDRSRIFSFRRLARRSLRRAKACNECHRVRRQLSAWRASSAPLLQDIAFAPAPMGNKLGPYETVSVTVRC